jgi:hypothetical protein
MWITVTVAAILSMVGSVGGTYYWMQTYSESSLPIVSASHKSDQTAIAQLQKIAEQEAVDARLGQYAINAMYKAGAKDKISDAKKQILARAIVRVANDIFDKEDNKKAFITVIAIESAFQRFVQSPTGPKGLTQVAKKAFYESMADCGVTSLHEEDVWETDINLYAGACYFRKQLDRNDGDPYMAIIAYNQGPNSDSLKSYAKNGSLDNIEVLKYVAKFTFLKRSVTDTVVPNVPAINDLPKPSSPRSGDK